MLFPRSIQWRIAIAYTLLIFATMGGVSLYLITFIRDSYVQALDDRLAQEAVLMADSIRVHFDTRARDTQTLVDFTARMAAATGARITVVDAGGNRLADSQPSAPIPSIVQPEFRSALTGIQGKEVRPDIQTGEEFRFIAAPVIVDDAIVGAIRVGAPTSQVQPNINRIITTVGIAAGVVAFLSIALGYYIGHWASVSIRNVTSGARRLAGGDLDHRVTPIGHDESRDMAEAFNQMAGTLRTIVGDLEQERGRLTAVLETMADGVVVIGSDDIVALINPAAAEMLEVREARPGDSLAEVVRDFELQRLVTQAQERGTPMRGEIELVPGHRSINVVVTPIADTGTGGMLITLHDRTETRRLEATRKEFVTNASHELRSPLASIKAMVETLEDGALDDASKSRDYLGRIHREVDRMAALMSDLLELSRLESGRMELRRQQVSPGKVVEEAIALARERVLVEGARLESDVMANIPSVAGEEHRLVQALFNLIENALKYTPRRGRVIVSARIQNGFIVFRVDDTGPGIAQEELPHVFERFYKVDRARRTTGTGLGLAIVKHTAQVHGGEVGIESRVGRGTSVWFTIPLAPQEASRPVARTTTSPRENA